MKQYRVWNETEEAQYLWLTESEAAERRRSGYYVREI